MSRGETITPNELIERLGRANREVAKKLEPAMRQVAEEARKKAVSNCTPGESPYDWLIFKSKVQRNIKRRRGNQMAGHGGSFVEFPGGENLGIVSGAPFDLGVLRADIYGAVIRDGRRLEAVVGSHVDYAWYVHEGTYKMAARPYLRDAGAALVDSGYVKNTIKAATAAALKELEHG